MQGRESRPGRKDRTRQRGRRAALLASLRAADRPLTVEEAARAIGLAESTTRFHLSLLVSAGEAERTPARSGAAGRPSWLYTATASPRLWPAPGSTDAGPYRDLARFLAAQMDGEAGAAEAAREAGRRWAGELPADAIRPASSPAEGRIALIEAFDRLGFAPDREPRPDEIVLHACPFESVAREHRAVVCGVHLGLAERTAAAIGGGLAVEGLEPFRSDRPLACAVRLRVPA